MATLQLENVIKNFGAVEVIKQVDLEVEDGEFVVFVGPSGCGKSTLLRIIAGLEDVSGGTIRIGGEVCNHKAPRDRGIAMVFQSYALYPHKTVYQNLAFGLKLARRPKAEIDVRIHEAARILQMENLLDRRPNQLSGGQRQRVAIGRAIVRNPKVFLFDEPLSNLDAALRVSMRREIARLHNELGSTMVYVTHDQVEAMTLADRIVVLSAGVVQQIGTPMELYHRPRNLFVAEFIGSPKMNTLAGQVVGVDDGSVRIASTAFGEVAVLVANGSGLEPGTAVTFGIRPEHVGIDHSASAKTIAGVHLVEELGDETLVEVRTDAGDDLILKLDASERVAIGDRLALDCRAEHAHVFDTEGIAFTKTQARD